MNHECMLSKGKTIPPDANFCPYCSLPIGQDFFQTCTLYYMLGTPVHKAIQSATYSMHNYNFMQNTEEQHRADFVKALKVSTEAIKKTQTIGDTVIDGFYDGVRRH
jgi:predicted amidophosphoribosyltransferase